MLYSWSIILPHFLSFCLWPRISLLVMLYCLSRASSWTWSTLSLSADPEDFLVSVGVIIFSYTSQIFLPPLEGSMEDRGQFNAMLGWTHGAACIMKTLFSLLVSDVVWLSKYSLELVWVCDASDGSERIIEVRLVLSELNKQSQFYYLLMARYLKNVQTEIKCTYGSTSGRQQQV